MLPQDRHFRQPYVDMSAYELCVSLRSAKGEIYFEMCIFHINLYFFFPIFELKLILNKISMSFYNKSDPKIDHSDSDSSLKSTSENSDLGYLLGVKNAMEQGQESMIEESNSKKNFNLLDFNYLLSDEDYGSDIDFETINDDAWEDEALDNNLSRSRHTDSTNKNIEILNYNKDLNNSLEFDPTSGYDCKEDLLSLQDDVKELLKYSFVSLSTRKIFPSPEDCKICKNGNIRVDHLRNGHSLPLVCSNCPNLFPTLDSLIKHVEAEHDIKPKPNSKNKRLNNKRLRLER